MAFFGTLAKERDDSFSVPAAFFHLIDDDSANISAATQPFFLLAVNWPLNFRSSAIAKGLPLLEEVVLFAVERPPEAFDNCVCPFLQFHPQTENESERLRESPKQQLRGVKDLMRMTKKELSSLSLLFLSQGN